MFKITTTRSNVKDADVDNEVSTTWYRFSSILELSEVLKSSYKLSHLSDSFPPAPPRCWNPQIDQFEKQFLNERKELLQNWARRICGLPRIGMNQDFLRFVQLKGIKMYMER
jgi:hypothetical protein